MAEKKAGAAGADGLPEVEVLLKGLMSQPGVEGFMVFNDSGIPLKWTQAAFVKPGTSSASSSATIPPSVVHHAALIGDLTAKSAATAAKLLGEEGGKLQLLRLRTRTGELLVAPGDDATLVVAQKAHSAVMTPLVATGSGPAGGAAAGGAAGAAAGGGDDKKAAASA